MMIFSIFAVGLLLASSVNAFWRMPCAKPVLDARVDPIVASGMPSSHAHTVMGSNAIGYNTSFTDLRNSQCTTCQVKDDKSAYWTPALYYQYANGTFQFVSHGGALVYYLQRYDSPNGNLSAFPDGIRLVTGDPLARSYSGTPESQAISWNCLNFSSSPPGIQTSGFPNTTCPDGLRAQVFFPSCWDGVNLDSSNHKSHMAYPDGIDSGVCPTTHPVRLVSIFIEIYFNTAPYNDQNDGGRFVLANGDPTGYGLHGDFLNGWDRDVLQRAVNTCTADSGVIEDCGVFQNENRFNSDDSMNSCSATDPISRDVIVDGIVPYLPGCVAVTQGPASATPKDLDPACSNRYRRSELKSESDDYTLTFTRTTVPADDVNVKRLRRHRAMRDLSA